MTKEQNNKYQIKVNSQISNSEQKKTQIKFSVILPTYHRPDDVDAFLQSMLKQTYSDFEIIIADGSEDDSVKNVYTAYTDNLRITYLYEKSIKASEARNWACDVSKGQYLVFIDSDCIVPSHYFSSIHKFLEKHPDAVAFGGADAADESFTPVQKAISYAMTSFYTTGGIRGKNKSIEKFHLRGFNMGIKREIFFQLGGFSKMQVAEDIDLSIRLYKAGYQAFFIPEAYVYHKRRDTLKKFSKQLKMHGKGRIDLYIRHKDSLKLVHFFPFFFDLFILGILISLFFSLKIFLIGIGILLLYALLLFIDAFVIYKKLNVAILSVCASFIMLTSYGLGFFQNFFKRIILKKNQETQKAKILRL
jgi:cellulose synthase/poly-beta-1,6-N-acetylglucosamine synthase-like glycosyltransferase